MLQLEAIVEKTKSKILTLQETWKQKEEELNDENIQLKRILDQINAETKQYESERHHFKHDEDEIRSAIKEKVINFKL